jgi:hypothetical protein
MRWLVMVAPGADLQAVMAMLAARGATLDRDQTPIPFDNGEHVIEVDGPPDFPRRIANVAGVCQVNPSSELTLF